MPQDWAQCDSCNRWRRVVSAPDESLPWHCHMHPDATCYTPEEHIEPDLGDDSLIHQVEFLLPCTMHTSGTVYSIGQVLTAYSIWHTEKEYTNGMDMDIRNTWHTDIRHMSIQHSAYGTLLAAVSYCLLVVHQVEFLVESRYIPDSSNQEYLVRWSGYSSSADSWQVCK